MDKDTKEMFRDVLSLIQYLAWEVDSVYEELSGHNYIDFSKVTSITRVVNELKEKLEKQ